MSIRLSDRGRNRFISATRCVTRWVGTRNGYPSRLSWIGPRIGFWLISVISVIAVAGCAGWIFVRADAANPPLAPPVRSAVSLSTALAPDVQEAAPRNAPWNGTAPGGHGSGIQESNIAPAETSGDEEGLSSAPPAKAVASVDGMRLLRQSLRRGGLGSKALMTLTIRNSNDYPVKHIQLLCSFRSRDGYVTRRRHTIDGVVKSNSRRTFRHMMVGFVSINANRAKCSLLSADWA